MPAVPILVESSDFSQKGVKADLLNDDTKLNRWYQVSMARVHVITPC
jgi:hypothetical protein